MVAMEKNQSEEGRPKINSTPIVENTAEVEPEGKKRKPWILIGSIAVLLVLVAGLTIWAYPYLMGNGESAASSEEEAAPESAPKQVKATMALDPFLVNLADKDGVRFVKATFLLGLEEKLDANSQSDVAVAAMRDSIISLLSTKTAEQILTPQGKDKLREEILAQVGEKNPGARILEVYIVDFVVQL